MTQIFIGNRAGYGPALRILKDDNDDPITTPATDYEKFIFDSETNKLAYLNRLVRIQWDDTLPSPPGTGAANAITTYYPPGSDINTFEYAVSYIRAGDNSNSRQTHMWPVDSMGFPGLVGLKSLNAVSGQVAEASSTYARYDRGEAGDIRETGAWGSGTSGNPGPTQVGNRPVLVATIRYGVRNTSQPILFEWKLPSENIPYPFPDSTPVSGPEALRIAPEMARLARPGYDVSDPNPNNFIFHENQNPSKLIGVGSIEIEAGATVLVPTVLSPSLTTYIDCVLSSDGVTYAKPMPAPSGASSSDNYQLQSRATSSGVEFINSGNKKMWVRYMIFSDDGVGPTSGGERVLSSDNGYFQIKRPGSSDSNPSFADILIDSRLPVPLLVAEGYFAWGDMTPVTNQRNLGSRRYTVNVPDAPGKYQLLPVFASPYHGILRAYFLSSTYNGWAQRGSNIAIVHDDRVDFWLANDHPRYINLSGGAVNEGSGPAGVRYYIFAVPLSL
ncbi:hypothetical protein [Aquamicrobium defluvii]|uniref:Uncharacterized protein n=1 Tax=Aquamicrobium defluvii TaxID=69279 RepID=A0A011TX09_9HYPH|nr:hypothetical protein [Aquamicrobium defluvii]EXL08732.1 hypothetical protein BG36_03450 [Aquamicrobium defluvii]EZQ14901.1 hypothetical protein CF98_14950 [Halopseudomonas bauzanensis]